VVESVGEGYEDNSWVTDHVGRSGRPQESVSCSGMLNVDFVLHEFLDDMAKKRRLRYRHFCNMMNGGRVWSRLSHPAQY